MTCSVPNIFTSESRPSGSHVLKLEKSYQMSSSIVSWGI